MRLLASTADQEIRLRPRKWRRRKADRPSEILDAALSVFRDRSVSAATLDDIALAAGVKRTTIYIYFKNKEQIFAELTRVFLPKIPDTYELNARLKRLPVEDQLRELATIVCSSLNEPQTATLLRLVVAETSNFPRIAREYRDAIAELLHRPLAMVIERGVAQGKFRPIDPRLAAHLAVTVPTFAAIWNAPTNAADWAALLETHVDFFIAAMMALPAARPSAFGHAAL